jgi:hypothetical protein
MNVIFRFITETGLWRHELYATYALERICAPNGRLVCSTGSGDIRREFVADRSHFFGGLLPGL